MQLTEVTGKSLGKAFILMPLKIYKDDPNYIRPLDHDVNDVFDPRKNKAFRFGTCKRWLLMDDEGHSIGRIAAFTNSKYKNKGDEQKTGGIGFFECIDDQQAADMLFDVAKSWLLQNGMGAMDGPINFGERDRFWGLVVEGFKPPIYLMNYNPPYYQRLFEDYGFKPFFNQLCFTMDVFFKMEDRLIAANEKFEKMPEFQARIINKNNLGEFAHNFVQVYNQAWASHEGNKEMKERTALKMFKSMKPIIDERIAWFVFHKDRPVAFFINVPELNHIFRDYNGKFGLWQKLHFTFSSKKRNLEKFTGILFGIIPEYQGIGIDYYMIVQAAKYIQTHTKYTSYEMQWIGDFNPRMINIAEHITARVNRRLTTYRYLFDRTKEYKRHPILR